MSADIDCAVFTAPHQGAWINEWLTRHRGMRRLHLTPVCLVSSERGSGEVAPGAQGAGFSALPVRVLRDTCLTLYRYQACLMPVDAATLSWVRTVLSSLTEDLPLPLLCITQDLKAEAVSDLFRFGLLDFIDHHASQDEIRARCTEVVKNLRRRHRVAACGGASAAPMPVDASSSRSNCSGIAERHAIYRATGEVDAASTVHQFSRGSPPLPGFPERSGTRAADPILQTETSFRQAKQHVIDHFEAQFLKTALAQHRGNVAGAARACAKHRRAFWALMRKHGIQANTFRKHPGTMPLG